ncbi:MAG TPA: hypothetical protein VF412_09620 [Bdellovibrio sp.]|uniref:hypothetical protein n=1 Tax=Bdellovibrio sp. TaxID=28201 RepID=UPI002EF07A40
MEPELQRQRPERNQQRPSSPPSKAEIRQKEFRKISEKGIRTQTARKNYAQEVCVVLGFTFFVVGLLGFVMPYFLNMHLSYMLNVIHFVTGLAALWFGFQGLQTAKRFNYIAGAIYLVLGLLGYVAGVHGAASVANPVEDDFLWVAIPRVLELGSVDHVVNIVAGLIFIMAAWLSVPRKVRVEEF